MKFINQLEPNALIANFIINPPHNFETWLSPSGIPFFSTRFDLLTTADPKFANYIRKIPFYSHWRKWLAPSTCFVGTTVSEYLPLTGDSPASVLAKQIKQGYAKQFAFLIVKDIADDSPLQDEPANHYSKELIQCLKDEGFIELEGQALAWVPIDFKNIEEFLSRFSYNRRKDFRRKLKLQNQLSIIELRSGDQRFFDTNVLDKYYQMYLNVYEQSEIHFDLLTQAFFSQLLQDPTNNAIIFCYYSAEKLIGYNICFFYNNMLVDKYIGFNYPEARCFNLYYISWFHNLSYAKKHNLTKYIAGWTDPTVKAQLGATFTFTKHLVYIRHSLLRMMLRKLSHRFENDHRLIPLKKK